jgi:hypothetical protein
MPQFESLANRAAAKKAVRAVKKRKGGFQTRPYHSDSDFAFFAVK